VLLLEKSIFQILFFFPYLTEFKGHRGWAMTILKRKSKTKQIQNQRKSIKPKDWLVQ